MLELVIRSTGGRVKRKAFILLSSQPEPQLAAILQQASINVCLYSSNNEHEEAWTLLTSGTNSEAKSPQKPIEDAIRRMLSTVFAQLRLREDRSTRSAVLAAMVMVPLSKACEKGPCNLADFVSEARRTLGLRESQTDMVRHSLSYLAELGQIKLDDQTIALISEAPHGPSTNLFRLVTGVLTRAQVRYRIPVTEKLAEPLQELLTRLLVADGLVIAYGLMKRTPVEDRRLDNLLARSLDTMSISHRRELEKLKEPILHLFRNPDQEEERLLDSLATITFDASILLLDPSMIGYAESLRGRDVYLDASILLPWLCKGHPINTLYSKIVDGLASFRPCVAEFYLNELVSHRRLAIEAFEQEDFSDADRFARFGMLSQLHNMNAYLGGFAGLLQSGFTGNFSRYLEEHAPFTNEQEAKEYLTNRGIRIISEPELYHMREDNISMVASLIKDGLRDQHKPPRDQTRLFHDSKMICFLKRMQASPTAPLFITADRVFLKCFIGTDFLATLRQIVLPHQAIYLAELADTTTGNLRGLSRMLWSVPPDKITHLRDFYTDRVLREYEFLLLEDLERIVDTVVGEIEKLGDLMGSLDFDQTELNRTTKFFRSLDRFEPRFHELMLQAKEKHGLVEKDPSKSTKRKKQ